MLKCDFNKVAKQSNFIEITRQHGCSPVNLLHIFRTALPRNTPGWLLLYNPVHNIWEYYKILVEVSLPTIKTYIYI